MNVFWYRRDLRPTDNRGLARAAATDDPVVPLFVLDPTVLEHASSVRVACLLEALDDLRSWFRERGSDLLVVRGEASAAVPEVAAEYDATRVVWNEDYSGLASERDRAVRAALEAEAIATESIHDAVHHEPGSITPNRGDHYSVFSYFWKTWRDRDKRDPATEPAADDLAAVSGEPIPTLVALGFDEPEATPPTVTTAAARERVADFCSGPIYEYATQRDRPAESGTSRLSPHLKWGTIGSRELYAATERAARRAETDDDRESVREFQRQLA